MSPELHFTGERFLPECAGEIAYEHWHRYDFARHLAKGKRVLDLACGEGYGSASLAQAGGEVLGVDVDAQAIAHAQVRYAGVSGCRFLVASAGQVPLPDASVDLVVSFETIEHVEQETQERMLAEFSRLLAPGGLLLISSPNKATYSDEAGFANEFHVRELYRAEFAALLGLHWPAQLWFAQKIQCLSAIWAEQAGTGYDARMIDDGKAGPYPGPEAVYFVVLASRSAEDLPKALPGVSLFLDRGETLLAGKERALRELGALSQALEAERLRLTRLVGERDQALEARDGHIKHLDALKAHCEAVVVERDAQLAGVQAHVQHLEILVAERERVVQERDAQVAAISELLREEQQAHSSLVLELRESLQIRTALDQTLQGLEAERARLLHEVEHYVRHVADIERESGELRKIIAEQQAVVLYRQSFRWWLRLPMARLMMALRKR